ncbi:pantetheine-phosphate adenylyltransferase [Rhodospirillum rubrum]|uniref:Phosphopantetheine adenylyltransferase n=1 Tax=Rhodospirillum rubrum (strain ATCC 11170 / ATH 1.1.1 / DSM 467 / LMG 4362 / NCIMB 8255 / S1) TaxID=269796 RepID=COAD_RHORT|nr:pantetheine-phosphate adenylyltransferase [Rhodospirillum rubrum]Q2RTK2.1 RecName: Full=Phosphopantetheine adenylyltransferase; AltName: Full=Dephospho-CoA pyrophosphorylase; AltName: Full=Pantetheine-phosphate adenylyltransferase; Short=PPAT [Rhodospirillum rubrum ATCC 11170]ABC22543.1 Coenzyme A biosynthesis protein [Rhodospirillum rubrum ATCC 11170]MBK5954131.1 phosphopantetheine adenylyltransferase [Rhodospirillum rubrum]QXG82172.1 pantetheine-phosphate adenylyltransferase [Rhodospirillu
MMPTERIAVYPGTFDPVTNGHLDIISRAARLVDRLTVGVAVNAGKGPLFSLEERVEMVRVAVDKLPTNGATITVVPFANLLMDFACAQGASMIFRGLRAISDFEYEFQMCGMNSRLNSKVETVFLMASERSQFISSRFVKEIGRLGGDIGGFVPAHVRDRLLDRFEEDAESA